MFPCTNVRLSRLAFLDDVISQDEPTARAILNWFEPVLYFNLFQDTGISCEPGDAISIICQNQALEVDILLNRLGYSKTADSPCKISLLSTAKKSAKIPDFFPPNSSLRQLFLSCLDIRSVPKKVLP